mmetsp:Transcript_24810/g.83390  ORF Transcript_24810/g.83390 Transcript_24810/m.83390 type:complete len:854 (-) Transcript_24810:131-2692(-)
MDWQALGDVQYRKWPMYKLAWRVAVGESRLCGAPCGGPVAVLPLTFGEDASLEIFSTSGNRIGCVSSAGWGAAVAGMGWTDGEQLAVILEDGTLLLHDSAGNLTQSFALTAGAAVVRVVVWGAGVVVLTSNFQLWACDDVAAPGARVYAMASGLSKLRGCTAMVVLEPRFTASGDVEVLLATSDKTVLVADGRGVEDQLLQERLPAAITAMTVAPNGRFLACFTANGTLSVMSTAFTTKVLDFDTSTTAEPLQMTWCGEDSVILHWRHFLLMVGPYGHWLKFPYDGPAHVVAEADCCRIVTKTSCEVLQRVPAAIEVIHRIGSTDASAMLYDAYEAFSSGDSKADANMRSLDSQELLLGAMLTAISAAAAELDAAQQQKYLRVAAYGKSFCEAGTFPADDFVAAARKLRVLNTLRQSDPAMCLTCAQLDALQPATIIDRLVSRGKHALALSVAHYLGHATDRVALHWACAKIKKLSPTSMTDEALRDALRGKLSGHDVPYSQLASAAHAAGRRRLAQLLLEYEGDAAEQVKVLLGMEEYDAALHKATAALDVDVIYLVLLSLERASFAAPDDFFKIVARYKEPTALLVAYYRQHARLDRGGAVHLHNLLVAVGSHAPGVKTTTQPTAQALVDAGHVAVREAYRAAAMDRRTAKLREAAALFGQTKDAALEHRAAEEQLDLLRIQVELERNFGVRCFVDMSTAETVYNLVALAAAQPQNAVELHAAAAQLQRRFKLPEKQGAHLKLKALAASAQWPALRAYASDKKSSAASIGLAPFARACAAGAQPVADVEWYVDRLPVEERFAVCIELSLWRGALDAAVKLKSPNKLAEVQQTCKDPDVVQRAQDAMTRLQS